MPEDSNQKYRTRQTQTQTDQIPELDVEELERQTQTSSPKEREFTQEDAEGLEKILNDMHSAFNITQAKQQAKQQYKQAYEASLKSQTAQYQQSAVAGTDQLLNQIEALKFRLLPYLANSAVREAALQAIGPIGTALSQMINIKGKLSPSQSKNILINANAIHYYLNQLPQKTAYKILFTPVKGAFKILAFGGGPFVKSIEIEDTKWNPETNSFQTQIKQKAVIGPWANWSVKANRWADRIDDKLAIKYKDEHGQHQVFKKSSMGHLSEEKEAHYFNQNLNQNLTKINKLRTTAALASDESTRQKHLKDLKTQTNYLQSLLRLKDGGFIDSHKKGAAGALDESIRIFGGSFRGAVRNARHKTAKKLRETSRDPLSYALTLLASSIYNFTAGLALNTAKNLGLQALNQFQTTATLRAQITRFLTTDKFITTARFGTLQGKLAFKALASLNNIGYGLTGYQAGVGLANLYNTAINRIFGINAAVVPTNTLGGIFAAGTTGLGLFHRLGTLHITSGPSLQLINGPVTYGGLGPVPQYVQWANQHYHGSSPLYRNTLWGKRLIYQPIDPHTGVNLLSEQSMLSYNKLHPNHYNTNLSTEKLLSQHGYKYYDSAAWKPGPISRYTTWLWKHPYARHFLTSIRSFGIGSALANFLPEQYASLGHWLRFGLPAVDFLWHAKGLIASDLIYGWKPVQWVAQKVYMPFQELAMRMVYRGNYYNFKSVSSEAIKGFKLFSPLNPTTQMRLPFRVAKNIFGNFLNPGFFAGLTLIPALTAQGLPLWQAAIAGPVLGSAGYLGYSAIVSMGFMKAPSLAVNMFRVTQLSWVGQLLGYITYGALRLMGVTSIPLWALNLGFTLGWPIAWPAISAAFPAFAQAIGAGVISTIEFILGPSLTSSIVSLATASTVIATATVVGVTLFSAFVIVTAFQSYQQGLEAGPQSQCFDYTIGATITDRQTEPPQDFGGRITDINSQGLDTLLDRSQYTHLDPVVGEQILFHQTITIDSQLYPENFIRLENTPGPYWTDIKSDQFVAFKTYPNNLVEPMTIINWTAQTIDLALDGPNTLEEITDSNFYPTYYPQVKSLIENLSLDPLFAAEQVKLELSLHQKLIPEIDNIASGPTTLIPDNLKFYLDEHNYNFSGELNSLPQTQVYLTTLNKIYQDYVNNHQNTTTLQNQLYAFINTLEDETTNLESQVDALETQSEEAQQQFVTDQTAQIQEAQVTIQSQISTAKQIILIASNPSLIPEAEQYLSGSSMDPTIAYEYQERFSSLDQNSDTFNDDLKLILADAQNLKNNLQDYYNNLDEQKKQVEKMANSNLIDQEFYHLPQYTQIDVFYTLTLAVDLEDQPLNISGGVSVMSGTANSETSCRANNELTLTTSPSEVIESP